MMTGALPQRTMLWIDSGHEEVNTDCQKDVYDQPGYSSDPATSAETIEKQHPFS